MRYTAFTTALVLCSLSAAPAVALTASGDAVTPATSVTDRHARQSVGGETMWFLLVDMASQCSAQHRLFSGPACLRTTQQSGGPKTLPKLQ